MPAYSPHLRKEELKNRVAADVFGTFDCARISCGAGLFNTETQSHGDTEHRRDSVPLSLCASVLKSTRPEGRIPMVNHWIPFPESEVDAKDAYQSHFMVEFLRRVGGAASGRAENLNAEAQRRGDGGAVCAAECRISQDASAPLRLCVEKSPSQPLLFGGAGGAPGGRALPLAAEAGAEYDGLLPEGFNTETQSHGGTEQNRASVPLGLCASVLKSTRLEGRIPAFSPAAQAVFDAGFLR